MLSKKHLYTGLTALLLSFLMTEVDPRSWYVEELAAYSHSEAEMFSFVTRPEDVHEWFPLFSRVLELDATRPMGVGKRFRAESQIPLGLATYVQDLEVVEYEAAAASKKLVLESDGFLRPVISIEAIRASDKRRDRRSELKVGFYFNRKSALFQYAIAPFLRFLTTQHVRHGLFVLNWILPPQ